MGQHRSDAERDDLARWVVKQRFVGVVRNGPPLSMAEVFAAAQRDGKAISSPRDAQRLYWRAFEEGLVQVEVRDTPRRLVELNEDHRLGDRLTRAVRATTASAAHFVARVVNLDLPTGANDDEVQRQLGAHCGRTYLTSEISDGDRLALAAGRAVAAAMEGLVEGRGLGGLSLYSLTGSAERGLGAVAGSSLDADSLIRWSCAACGPDELPDKVRYVTLPQGLPEQVMQRGGREGDFLREVAGFLLEDWWMKRRPDVVLLGVSPLDRSLHDKHPLWITRNPFLRDDLKRLTEVLEAHHESGLEVGEVALRLWVTNPSGTPGADQAAALCARLNARTVGPTYEALRHGRRRVVIAGGRSKANVIESLLRGDAGGCVPSLLGDCRAAG